MKPILIALILLVGCAPTVDEFKEAQKKCAEIDRVATVMTLIGSHVRCCNNMDCGVIAK